MEPAGDDGAACLLGVERVQPAVALGLRDDPGREGCVGGALGQPGVEAARIGLQREEAAHPHVLGISGGIAVDEHGRLGPDVVDRLGHGTAVAAAIREKAPGAPLLAVNVFDRALSTSGLALAAAIRWAAAQEVALINLSLGTLNAEHEAALADAIAEAARHGAMLVAAAPQDGDRWLPGALDGVIQVEAEWDRDRSTCDVTVRSGRMLVRASPYPRPIPGVPPERNLKGVSFAVANATGLLALLLEVAGVRSVHELGRRLELGE